MQIYAKTALVVLLRAVFYEDLINYISKIPLLHAISTPSALVLGAWKFFPSYGQITTADVYEKSGIYHIATDLGEGINNGILVVFNSGLTKTGDKQFAVQLFFPSDTSFSHFYVRLYWYGTWAQWRKVNYNV